MRRFRSGFLKRTGDAKLDPLRLWSLHPRLLDRRALVAVWREGLLAQAVLLERTRGYRHHPQLERFRETADPPASIAAYLRDVAAEAAARGYSFDAARIVGAGPAPRRLAMTVTDGQLAFEWEHLRAKVLARDPDWGRKLPPVPEPHPLFVVVEGGRAAWERG